MRMLLKPHPKKADSNHLVFAAVGKQTGSVLPVFTWLPSQTKFSSFLCGYLRQQAGINLSLG